MCVKKTHHTKKSTQQHTRTTDGLLVGLYLLRGANYRLQIFNSQHITMEAQDGVHADIPDEFKELRACLRCTLIKTFTQVGR